MTGCYDHKIDEKGRLSIPSDLRDELGEVFHITISSEACLTAHPNESWDRIIEKFKTMTTKQQRSIRPLFANAAKCELDKQGRFLIPQKLRDHARLTKDVAVVGMGTMIQLWDAEEFKRINEQEATPENLDRVMDELDF